MMKVLYPLELTMSEVRERFEEEYGYSPRVVLHTDKGWEVTDEVELEKQDNKDDELHES